ELERLERREAIDVDVAERIDRRVLLRGLVRASEQIELRAPGPRPPAERSVCAARERGPLLEVAQDGAGAREDQLWQPGQARPRDAVAPRRRPVLQLVEEDDVPLMLARGHAPVLAGAAGGRRPAVV